MDSIPTSHTPETAADEADETKPKHTPTMWVYDGGGFIGTPAGQLICQFFDKCEEDFVNADANAEFICRAVNSHYELLAACRAAISHLNLSTTSAKALKKQIRAAIKSAEPR